MQITKREFLRKLGLVGAAGVTGAALGAQEGARRGRCVPGLIARALT